jgi:hypothetical protein
LWYTGGMPGDARPLALDDEIRAAIGGAFDSLNCGSTHVYGPQQVAIWVRKREDGLAKAVETRPEVTLFYVDLVERGVAYTFYGRGRVTDDPEVADRVFAAAPEGEQAQDPERAGIPLIIDLERVVAQGRRPEQNFVMERSAT